ncbi:polysaccharide biosynthesis/export family protein [Desulfogranum marinum]|uniref:polysaccharide biosynthesis/export family protein n=1 Tax=Desulfogranum marinum TaxID=453220 RepID=UPI001E2E007F|nr:polysaccharide biosynthesis/export family protein [Desulfogranum marinum]
MIRQILLSFLFLLLLAVPAMAQDYVVEEDDVLKITVYDHDDLTTMVRVSGDGTINLPLLNKVKVAGLTSTQISDKITALFADGYVINPQVNVFVEDFRSRVVYVSGEVNKPDAYKYEKNMTVIKAITKAGGFSNKASKQSVTIIRKSNGREQVVDKVKMDEPILPEDLILVPESLF